MSTHIREPRLDRKTKSALIVFLVGVIASVVGLATWSAFSATTANSGNQFQTGSVILTDNDSGTAMFNMTNARPGDTVSKCITVTYTGTLTANVRLYGAATAGNGLDSYLDLQVTRGTFSGATPANMACTDGAGSNFVADSVTYSGGNGAGAGGVLFNARMNNYPTTWASGIVDAPGGTPEAWTNPEPHVYRFTVTVANDNNAANKNHTQTFTWEAQDV
jgi:predicted ribosomally synthesized peptide with SipW-like signal peptide